MYMTEAAKPAKNYFPREHKNNVSTIMQHFSSRGVAQLQKLLYWYVDDN